MDFGVQGIPASCLSVAKKGEALQPVQHDMMMTTRYIRNDTSDRNNRAC